MRVPNLLIAVALATGCNQATPPTTQPVVPEAASDTGPSATTGPAATGGVVPEGDPWIITAEGIGPVVLGEPVPAAMRVSAQYALRLYGDFQPLEGFWNDESAVFAALATGPYHRRVEGGDIEPPPAETLAAAAVKDAESTPVAMVYVESARARTEQGVRVGMRYAEFAGIHADAKVAPFPVLFEEPTCMGAAPELPHVHFFFDKCGAKAPPPSDAAIIRIAVRE